MLFELTDKASSFSEGAGGCVQMIKESHSWTFLSKHAKVKVHKKEILPDC